MTTSSCIIRTGYNENATEQLYIDQAKAALYDRNFPSIVMLTLFGMIGLPGNAAVVLVYYKNQKITATQFLIFIIAIVDFFSGLIVIPYILIYLLYWLEINSFFFCRIMWALLIAAIGPEVYLIAGLSFVRYCHVCKPHSLHRIESMVKPFSACCFLVGILLSGTMGICAGCKPWSEEDLYTPGFRCLALFGCEKIVFITFVSSLLFSYIMCLIAIITLNILILRRMLKQEAIMEKYRSRKRKHNIDNNEHVKDKTKELATISEGQKDDKPADSVLSSSRSIFNRMKRALVSNFSKDDKSNKMDNVSETPALEHTRDIPGEDDTKSLEIDCTSSLRDSFTHYVRNSIVSGILGREAEEDPAKESHQSNSKNTVTGNSSTFGASQAATMSDKLEVVEESLEKKKKSMDSDKKSHHSGKSGTSGKKGKRHRKKKHMKHKRRSTGIQVKPIESIQAQSIQATGIQHSKHDVHRNDAENKEHKEPVRCFKIHRWNRTTLKLFLVSVVYVVTYMPIIILVTFASTAVKLKDENLHHDLFKYFIFPAIFFVFFGSAANPLVYTFVDPKFRSQCRVVFGYKK